MSYAVCLIKQAIAWMPMKVLLPVVNMRLRGIARLTGLEVDLAARSLAVEAVLEGEPAPVAVSLRGFCVRKEADGYVVSLGEARASQPWLANLLARLAGRPWRLPAVPELAAYLDLAAELLADPPAADGGA